MLSFRYFDILSRFDRIPVQGVTILKLMTKRNKLLGYLMQKLKILFSYELFLNKIPVI